MKKKYLMFTLMAVLISLLAVSAYAQSGTQTQTQIKPSEPVATQTDEGPKGDGTATTDRTRTSSTTGLTEKSATTDKSGEQPKEAVQTKPENPIRDYTLEDPQGDGTETADRSRKSHETQQEPQSDKVLEATKSGDQTQEMNYGTGDGNNHELGENNRHGDEYTGETGPHGNVDDGSDKSGDMTYGESDGNNHELGDNNRHGEDYTGETGPHGLTTDLDKEMSEFMGLDKMFGEGADGTFAGSMLRHSWGPGESGIGGHFGPMEGGHFGPGQSNGFGPAGSDVGTGGSTISETKGQSRAGRR